MKWVLGLVALFVVSIFAFQEPRKPVEPCGAAREMSASTGGRVSAAEAARTLCDNDAAQDAIDGLKRERYEN